jgi:hypothetical protein
MESPVNDDEGIKKRGCCSSGPEQAVEQRSTKRPEELKKSLASRLARIEGQVRGVRRMIEGRRLLRRCPCPELRGPLGPGPHGPGRAGAPHEALPDRTVRAGDDAIVDEIMDTLSKFM